MREITFKLGPAKGDPVRLGSSFSRCALEGLASTWIAERIKETKGQVGIRELADIAFCCGRELHPTMGPK